jgi:DNA-binding transcriptional MerR regulator
MSEFILFQEATLATVRQAGPGAATYPLETAARLADVHPDVLRYYCRLGLLGRARAGVLELIFDDEAIYEVRRIEHYRRHRGVNRQALPLVLELLREVERLEAELRFLRSP